MKKCISFFLILSLFIFSACDIAEIEEIGGAISEEAEITDVDTSTFGVGFASGESADPYTTKNKLNFELMGLICEPLFSLSENFEAEPVLCESFSYSDKTYVFNIKKNVTFSDKSALLPSDVEYSLKAACEPGSYYASNLSIIESISSSDRKGTVTVTLKYANSRFPALLDIPIIKNGTRGNALPTGTGIYAPKDDLLALVARTNHHSGKEPEYSVISLLDVSSSDELLFEFDNHTISILTSDPTGTAPLSPLSASQMKNVSSTRLHFIGFNMRRAPFSDKAARVAIARLIDRESAAQNDFALMGKPCELPFHPSFSSYPEEVSAALSYVGDLNLDISKPVTILVNTETSGKIAVCKRISETLTRLGVPCSVRALPFNEYATALTHGDFDLYYGEVSLSPDFDLTRILQGSLNYGGFYDAELLSLHSAYLAGDEARDNFFRAFCETVPFAPIMFKDTAIYYQSGFFEKLFPTAQNTYNSFCDWVVKK